MSKNSPPIVFATHEYLPFRGGVAVYVHEVAVAARALGHCAEIWTADRGVTQGGTTDGAGVVRFASNGRLTPSGLGALAWGWWQRRRELRGQTTLLMSVGAQMIFFWFDLLGIVPARRCVVLFYGSELLRFAQGRVWRWLAKRYYARAGGFAAISHYTAGLAHDSGLLPAGVEIAVAPCALPAAFAERPLPAVGPPDETTWRVLTVARLHPRKGQREVARALAGLSTAMKTRIVYQIVGVGDAAYRAEIEAEARAGGVRCEFLGGLSDAELGEVYARATLYVQASRTLERSVEGFGLSFVEAGFYGRPSAGFLAGGVAEAVVDGRTGLLVPEGDVPALTETIGRLLADPVLRARLGAAGREYALSLRWEEAARVLCEVAGQVAVGSGVSR